MISSILSDMAEILSLVLQSVMEQLQVIAPTPAEVGTRLSPVLQAVQQQLRGNTVFWIAVTVLGLGAGEWAHHRARHNPLINPVLVAALAVWCALCLTGSSMADYAAGGAVLKMFLAPITVALAVPTSRHLAKARHCWMAVATGIVAGGIVAVVVTIWVASQLGASIPTLLSLAPRSTTAAVSIEWSRILGGIVALTALLTTATGMVGAVCGTGLLKALGIRDERAVGLALGVASHALGTARALSVSERMGAFAAIGLAGNAIFTSAVLAVGLLLWAGAQPR